MRRFRQETFVKELLAKDPEALEALESLQAVIRAFHDTVYSRGLSDILDRCRLKGMEGRFGDVILRTYVMAGRVMLTFSRGDDDCTFLGAWKEPYPRWGSHSINATLESALSMVRAVIEAWPGAIVADPSSGGMAPAPNVVVGMGKEH